MSCTPHFDDACWGCPAPLPDTLRRYIVLGNTKQSALFIGLVPGNLQSGGCLRHDRLSRDGEDIGDEFAGSLAELMGSSRPPTACVSSPTESKRFHTRTCHVPLLDSHSPCPLNNMCRNPKVHRREGSWAGGIYSPERESTRDLLGHQPRPSAVSNPSPKLDRRTPWSREMQWFHRRSRLARPLSALRTKCGFRPERGNRVPSYPRSSQP